METIESVLDRHFKETFDPYLFALGKVVNSWNHLHESLGQLFGAVTALDKSMAYAIWNSTPSDRSQRTMLLSAIEAYGDDRWGKIDHHAKNDIKWLITETNKLGDRRNNAVHAPVSVSIASAGFQLVPCAYFGNPRARALLGKDLLEEFDWYQKSADALRVYSESIIMGMLMRDYAWPKRVLLPTLGQKNAHQDQRHQDFPK